MFEEAMREYWLTEGLDKYVSLPDDYFKNDGGMIDPFKNIDPLNRIPFAPEIEDLIFLYNKIRERKSLTILEFGTGYSTIIMGSALKRNYEDYFDEFKNSNIRCLTPFKLFSVDDDKSWIEESKKRIPEDLKDFVSISFSPAKADVFQGRICSYYENLPDIVPDFVYLDGPGLANIKGKVNGLSFSGCLERTPNAADLLLMEPSFNPGAMIVVDERMNNVRFLKNNFQRNWGISVDYRGDRSVFELNEEPLGIYNYARLKFQNLI